jgi:hypothetical protein
MAQAPGHRLGQIIGDALELSIQPVLQDFADAHSLYLDSKGPRPTRREQVKCTWVDDLENSHDLDFVLERGGTYKQVGTPAAFIETAWRRYTKHSRAKAQEIQGALLPLLAKYSNFKPFAGAVVAGKWTSGALAQLRTSGFAVLHIPYDEIVGVFAQFGLDVDSTENTPDAYLQEQVDTWDELSAEQRESVGTTIRGCSPDAFEEFKMSLARSILRVVESVRVLSLHGTGKECRTVEEAVAMLNSYHTPDIVPPLVRFEVGIRYTNGDRIEANFASAVDAETFLRSFQ